MSISTATADAADRTDRTVDRGIAVGLALLLAALAFSLAGARISYSLFFLGAAGTLAALAYLSLRLPQVTLIAVVFTPILDRYIANVLLPESLHDVTNYLSEALLALVTVSIAIHAWRSGRLLPALRHPVVGLVAAFGAMGLVSAAVNGVPPLIAIAGIVFTVDAVLLFVLARAAGVSAAQARYAFFAFTAVAGVAAFLALGQVFLDADFLGMQTFTGRFSEGRRVAAFLANPNMLGVVLAMAIPLPLLATTRQQRWGRRLAWGLLTFMLCLALFYTFSRGAWLGLALAGVMLGVLVNWRAFALLAAFGVVCYASAYVLPRHILEPEPGDAAFDPGAATIGRLDSLAGDTDLRVLFIRNAAPIIADHPFIGAGPGRYGGAVAWRFDSPLYDRYTSGSVPRDRTVDNFWLHLLTESGVLGALLFAGAILAAVAGAVARLRRMDGWPRLMLASAAAIAIIISVDSLAEMLLEGNTTSFATWFFLGVASVIGSPQKASR